jgi:hypothetical protein
MSLREIILICWQIRFLVCWKKCFSQLLNVHKFIESVLNKEDLPWQWEKYILVSMYKTVMKLTVVISREYYCYSSLRVMSIYELKFQHKISTTVQAFVRYW